MNMRARWEQKLNEVWYRNESAPWWLKTLTPLYRSSSRMVKRWKLNHSCTDLQDRCIVVVGNITAGGSGKTPLVIRLCKILAEAGFRPGVISRGYGRQARGLRLASSSSSPGVVGDEPLMIARRSGVPVIVAADRCEAARALFKKGSDVVISDDGLQHYRLPRSIEICVIDGSRGLGNGLLLPAGPLRESAERLETVDAVIVNGDVETAAFPSSSEWQGMALVAGLLRSLDSAQSWRLSQFRGCAVNAVAGIANPDRFFRLLRRSGITVNENPFPDHHAYKAEDFAALDRNLPIVMTEKDAVKCTPLGLKNAWFLSVDAVLPHEWEDAFVRRVSEIKDRPKPRETHG